MGEWLGRYSRSRAGHASFFQRHHVKNGPAVLPDYRQDLPLSRIRMGGWENDPASNPFPPGLARFNGREDGETKYRLIFIPRDNPILMTR